MDRKQNLGGGGFVKYIKGAYSGCFSRKHHRYANAPQQTTPREFDGIRRTNSGAEYQA